ncbi:dihydroneopterin aldolase [Sulfitobacter sp. M57]|uniref:dihydroneopterin aldolase n=1 Tax=unclassified Sulfitobacter TaxID=196795 RepID=UPI0023E26E39|nr:MULTISPECIES: dihydroneopterin aldolase [unclassified Sulfitobacter]MDF3414165.1 dihydroneopterin aldolase [Sulfitobacter sp. KE5]MDF3420554.1 dihydroneopterin aldolase [Sulfitobacter sp. KE43]MDF3432711.1 dihydroneopterin aldolase [Sulfitobacter sp. KE42]MDF3458350.1 dihydroneopterin aldolase [Sulfitobacter sp. S74]MDF3462251.1 dihydroneopterin aldolase [Sulfitobacter sp. Ks18]
MPNEVRLAFAHPSERADAMSETLSGSDPLDRISLRDHTVEVEIGAFQAERGVTQRICFNVVVEVRPLTGPIDDDVDRILSYDRVTEAIAAELAVERLALLETLAGRVAERILLEPQAMRVFVRIEKLDRGPGALGVEIVRTRAGEVAVELDAEEAPQPELVYLSNAAIASPHLKGWLDQLEAQGRPLILCVGAPETPAPNLPHKMAQRRIDLLAIEQNAWVLASKDDRCVVVETRTELDWAMKNGQTCVWAPSKIVLDAVDTPSAQPHDAVALAAWFAASFDAQEMLVVGAEGPGDSSVPLRVMDVTQAQL